MDLVVVGWLVIIALLLFALRRIAFSVENLPWPPDGPTEIESAGSVEAVDPPRRPTPTP